MEVQPRASAAFTTDRYTSPEFLEREKARVFRKTWLAVARESDVPRDGDCLTIDELGESLVIVRGTDHAVRTFRNTCRHRGTRLVSGRCHASQITCPYHGWTYGLDGRLVSVPKANGFDRLDTGAYGLLPIRTACWGGFVWMTFDADAPPLLEYLGAVADHLAPYGLPDMRPLFRRTWTLRCNWKAVLEQALESYHIHAVHPRLGEVLDAGLTLHALDPHGLQTIPIPS